MYEGAVQHYNYSRGNKYNYNRVHHGATVGVENWIPAISQDALRDGRKGDLQHKRYTSKPEATLERFVIRNVFLGVRLLQYN